MDPTNQSGELFVRTNVERLIAAVRIGLATASLLAVWIDPEEPAHQVRLTYALHISYVLYALVLVRVMWRRDSSGRLPVATHLGDIAFASVFQYLTTGPSSPFLLYFTFALFSAAMRWSWRATTLTAGLVLGMFLAGSMVFSWTLVDSAFDANRLIIRTTYLAVVTIALLFLGQHEAHLREQIQQLASWPRSSGEDSSADVVEILDHAADVLGASGVMVIWSEDDEPWLHVVSHAADGSQVSRHAPDDFEPIVHPALAERTFFCAPQMRGSATVRVSEGGTLVRWTGVPMHEELVRRLPGANLASTPFRSPHFSGRIFFTDLPTIGTRAVPLVELVARQIVSSLERLHGLRQSRQLAIAEDRLKVARDLHDGILQSLTGIRLRLRALAGGETDQSVIESHPLMSLERALAGEQTGLRRLIEDLRPASSRAARPSLADRLDIIQARTMEQWQVPVSVTLTPAGAEVPMALEGSVALMVHEAIMNALKHGVPGHVSIDVVVAADRLTITAVDDGHGFGFTGRRDHETLVAINAGPRSLRERVTSLGGRISVESGPRGSRVELSVPFAATRPLAAEPARQSA